MIHLSEGNPTNSNLVWAVSDVFNNKNSKIEMFEAKKTWSDMANKETRIKKELL